MSNHAQGWRQVNNIEMMPVESSTGLIRAILAFVVLITISYTIASADCSTGNHFGGCNVSSGSWFDHIATFLLR